MLKFTSAITGSNPATAIVTVAATPGTLPPALSGMATGGPA